MDATTSSHNALKRKQPPEDDCEQHKKPRSDSDYRPGITDLSDCLLSHLFRYLDATSLYCLSQTCVRFDGISRDPRYWLYVEGRRRPSSAGKVAYCEENLHKKTTYVMLAHNAMDKEALSPDFLELMNRFDRLNVLALENQKINGNKYPLRIFPQTLQEISLRRTHISSSLYFLRFARVLDQLRVLLLDYCDWVESSSLVSLANFKSLEILSLYMCRGLSDERSIGYLGVASHGFKKLKILDARFSGLGSRLIFTLYQSPTLQEIYFQGYSTTYQLERLRRKLAVMCGAERDEFALSSDEDEEIDKGRKLRPSYADDIDDLGLIMMQYLLPSKQRAPKPTSLLFKDVYGECNCGFRKSTTEKEETQSLRRRQMRPEDNQCTTDDDDDVRNSKLELMKKIKRRRRRLSRMLHSRQVPNDPFNAVNTGREFESPGAGQNQCVIVVDLSHNVSEVHCEHYNDSHPLNNILSPSQHDSPASTEQPACDSDTEPDHYSDSESSSSSAPSDDDDEHNGNQLGSLVRYFRLGFDEHRPVMLRSNLRRLSLRGYPNVTQNVLRHLNGLGLELLDVRYTNVKGKAIRKFMRMNPRCRVVHRSACVCAPRLHF